MKNQEQENLEDLIRQEQNHLVRELVGEAWEDGLTAEIEPELLAEEMIRAVIGELARSRSESDAHRLTETLGQMASEGRLMAPRILQ